MARKKRPEPSREAWNWLRRDPPLHELMERYPVLWQEAGGELVFVLEDRRAQALNDYAARARSTATLWEGRIRRSRNNPAVIESALPHMVKSRMTMLAVEKCLFASATGRASGKVRFNLINGMIIQKLLFSEGLTRKPVSLGWFRFWWRIVRQKRFLMPLVQPKGIFCFYSHTLVRELATMIGERACLEIAAGDGTLSRFLAGEGVKITATDNHSWKSIPYPESVQKLDAVEALERYQPQVVLCSWPPPGNSFERHVFSTRSIELYIVIGSRYKFASGNWDAYASQNRFDWSIDRRLTGYVLPPELDPAVLTFIKSGSDHSNRLNQ